MAEQQDVARARVKLANVTEELLGETKTNNTVTALHNKLTIGLTVAIVVLALCTFVSNYNSTGRYAFVRGEGGEVLILDTKKSQVWGRTAFKIVNMGTIKKPIYKVPAKKLDQKFYKLIEESIIPKDDPNQ